jgi:hypothetical protein
MMKKRLIVSFLCINLSLLLNASDLRINLAEFKPGGTYKLNILDNTIDKIIVSNIFSEYSGQYLIEIEKKLIEIQPLPSLIATEGRKHTKEPCSIFEQALYDYRNIIDTENEWVEKLVSSHLRILFETRKDCTDPVLLEQFDEIINKTTSEFQINQKIELGEVANIRITRFDKVWNFVIEKPRGQWLISYGPIAIIPLFYHEESFHLEKTDNAGEYLIKKGENKNKFLKELIPAIFFNWMPYSNHTFNFGLSGGVSYQFDAQNLAIFAGGSLIYNYNLCVNFGVGIAKQQYLKEKYREGMIINENLEPDQLYESYYRPNLFLSISFRFGTNPFTQQKN